MSPQILMIGGSASNRDLVGRFAEELRALGAEVWLAGMSEVERTHSGLPLTGLRSLRSRAADLRSPEFYRRADQLGLAEETWAYVAADEWVLDRANRADVLVAIDARAVYAVWELARRNPHADAVFGLAPGLAAARERTTAAPLVTTLRRRVRQTVRTVRRRSRRAARRTIEGGAGSLVGRSSLVGGPAIRLVARKSPTAASTAAVSRIAALEAHGRLVQAETATREVLPTTSSARRRADVLGSVAFRHLAAGQHPPQLLEAFEAELAYADELFARGDAKRAATSYGQAVRLAFHRGNHLDATWSPLAADPVAFTEPFRRSAVVRELNRPRGRLAPAAPHTAGTPRRVLLATLGNANFLGDITARLAARDDIEVRSIVPADMAEANQVTRDPRKLISSLLAGDGRAERLAEKGLRPHLDWADTVLVDWCTHLPRVFQLIDPGTTRVLVRLHSYEAFTPWPLLLDSSRLDQLVFVSEHVRRLVLAERPDLDTSQVDTPVVTNGVDLRRFVRPKTVEARFTVALIGYKVVAKDVLWAFEAVRALRRRDPRYRLKLIGSDVEDFLSPAAARYAAEFRRQSKVLLADGGLIVTGHVDDVPGALQDAGTILCSSVREGSPVGVIEAVASGCVPVIRDWPFFAGDGRGARALYPRDWIVETPLEAAERLYRVTRDEPGWYEESVACANRALQEWDIGVVGSDYDRLFDVTPATGPGAFPQP